MTALANNHSGALTPSQSGTATVYAGKVYLYAGGTFATANIYHQPKADAPRVLVHQFSEAGVHAVEVPSGRLTAELDGTASGAFVIAEQ